VAVAGFDNESAFSALCLVANDGVGHFISPLSSILIETVLRGTGCTTTGNCIWGNE